MQLRVGDRQTGTSSASGTLPHHHRPRTRTGIARPDIGAQWNHYQWSQCGEPAQPLRLAVVTIPQIQYEDLGLTLKATPTVQKSGAIRLRSSSRSRPSRAGLAQQHSRPRQSSSIGSEVTVNDGDTALLVSTRDPHEVSQQSAAFPAWANLPGFQTATARRRPTPIPANFFCSSRRTSFAVARIFRLARSFPFNQRRQVSEHRCCCLRSSATPQSSLQCTALRV